MLAASAKLAESDNKSFTKVQVKVAISDPVAGLNDS